MHTLHLSPQSSIKHSFLLALSIFCACVGSASARTPGYDHVSVGYSDIKRTAGDDNQSLEVSFAYLLTDEFHLEASIADSQIELQEFDLSGDGNSYQLALSWVLSDALFLQVGRAKDKSSLSGFNTRNDSTYLGLAFFKQAQYSYFDLAVGAYDYDQKSDFEGESFADTSMYASAFYRHYFASFLELELDLRHVFSDQDFSTGSFSLIYKSQLPLDFYLGGTFGDSEGFWVGLRRNL